MNISRTITGGAITVFSLWFIADAGFMGSTGVDYIAVVTGIFFAAVGLFIIFNKKEDEIEKIKGQDISDKKSNLNKKY